MKKIYRITLCLIFLSILQCTTDKQIKHKNLWRFDDPYINQAIVNAWENIHRHRYEWAALDFTRLIQKNYIDYDILFGAGLAYFFMNDTSKAMEYFTRVIENNPEHFEALYFRAKLFLKLGDKLKARKDLNVIISMNYSGPFICGYYVDNDDLADRNVLNIRKKEANTLLQAINYD